MMSEFSIRQLYPCLDAEIVQTTRLGLSIVLEKNTGDLPLWARSENCELDDTYRLTMKPWMTCAGSRIPG